ncbi:MAG: response regulator [Zetaproteobacteria bacterium CG_4_9_14_3_um_filter_49_83]|nr:MAG: response regulator [Zetaproteobacteria bacterium CG1_02_49_23]PIQ32019.1 MAG: response regulator [Zetaproteobacteria bacterium CG17_big_fil_post_rev_8_21_14_2_50_50_13]PIV30553.1 MAG: response regulator [Zetaproteobacteria bacterium CG02_land_8_20_14_3_00_50_9]PIY56728.1 MAG: response regulator [Zetaproteobacteria bacterium CG_4_10_14_0_8_um_filter_49_80]PJA36498.1 MAG: response regulator [Zetaproteobacteria bacterium CG_4_9_14_3_um_filter_49_83]
MSLTGRKITIVDDTQSNLMLFTALLEVHGAEVSTVTGGREFFERLSELTPELVLLDIQMPEMDGYKVLDRLRTEKPATLPVIALTAHAMSGDREKMLERGFTGYIPKPINTREFPDQVAAYFSGGGA